LRASVLCIAVIGSLVSSAAFLNPPAPDDVAEIRAARVEQNQAIASRDFDRVAAFWLDDVQVTAGLGFTLRGREAYRRAFSMDSSMVYRRDPENVEVNSHWPIAWETGTWSGYQVNRGGSPLLRGRYSAQWIKQGDQWRIRAELFVALDCAGVACSWPPRP